VLVLPAKAVVLRPRRFPEAARPRSPDLFHPSSFSGSVTNITSRRSTTLGRSVATAALKLRELVVIPMLNQPVPA
jgi:hypothetical protein